MIDQAACRTGTRRRPLRGRLSRLAWLALAAAILALPAASEAGEAPDPASADYALILEDALPGQKPLNLSLEVRDGRVRAAFASARAFNRMAYDVDASGLKIEAERLAGLVKVTIPSDGYTPPEGTTLACQYTLQVAVQGGAGRGTFEGRCGETEMKGSAAASLEAPADAAAPAHVALDFENAIQLPKAKRGGARRARISFGLRDGRALGAKLTPPGSITDVSFAGRIESADLKLADGRLTGTIQALVTPNNGEAATLTYEVDGQVIGRAAAGRFRTRRGQETLEDGRFTGTLRRAAADPADCLYTMVLHDAVRPGCFLRLFAGCREGKFTGGFASTPNYNNATHEVDLAGLRLQGKTVKGEIGVTVHPDPWNPPDHKSVPCRYRIDAAVQDAEIVGTYEGTFGETQVRGPADGEIEERPPADKPVRVTIKLEDALTGGSAWQNRAFFAMDLEGDRVAGGKVSNNHTKLSGTVEEGQVTIDGDSLAARFKAAIEPGGGVQAGAYSFAARGTCVGDICAGNFETFLDGKGPIKTGRFWGTVHREPRPASP